MSIPTPLAAEPPGQASGTVANAASVDVEEYFHASALASAAPRSSWPHRESRVVQSTNRVLRLFADTGSRGTFFILGSIAERYPSLVRSIAAEGHEIGSHGYAHHSVGQLTRQEFLEDVRKTKAILENVSGQHVIGYRAPNFSINRDTWWAFDQLKAAGYAYSSSVYPIYHDHYGVVGAPKDPFFPVEGFLEVPMTAMSLGPMSLPAGGGGYFRLLPYALSRAAIRRVNRKERRRAVNYFHPWELDPGQPRLDLPLRSRFRHYVNLGIMESKLHRLFNDFRWSRMDRVFGDLLQDSAPGRAN